jgi:hypothetical protein
MAHDQYQELPGETPEQTLARLHGLSPPPAQKARCESAIQDAERRAREQKVPERVPGIPAATLGTTVVRHYKPFDPIPMGYLVKGGKAGLDKKYQEKLAEMKAAPGEVPTRDAILLALYEEQMQNDPKFSELYDANYEKWDASYKHKP